MTLPDDDTMTALAAALVDRNAYTRDNLTAAVRAYQQVGDVDTAANEVTGATVPTLDEDDGETADAFFDRVGFWPLEDPNRPACDVEPGCTGTPVGILCDSSLAHEHEDDERDWPPTAGCQTACAWHSTTDDGRHGMAKPPVHAAGAG